MFSLCHPWFTATNLSYTFPILETSATASCGSTGIYCIILYLINIISNHIIIYLLIWYILNVSTLYAVYTTHSSSVQPPIVDGVNDRQPKWLKLAWSSLRMKSRAPLDTFFQAYQVTSCDIPSHGPSGRLPVKTYRWGLIWETQIALHNLTVPPNMTLWSVQERKYHNKGPGCC